MLMEWLGNVLLVDGSIQILSDHRRSLIGGVLATRREHLKLDLRTQTSQTEK